MKKKSSDCLQLSMLYTKITCALITKKGIRSIWNSATSQEYNQESPCCMELPDLATKHCWRCGELHCVRVVLKCSLSTSLDDMGRISGANHRLLPQERLLWSPTLHIYSQSPFTSHAKLYFLL